MGPGTRDPKIFKWDPGLGTPKKGTGTLKYLSATPNFQFSIVLIAYSTLNILHFTSVCNFNPRKVSWNWIAFSQNSFVISPGLLYHLITRDNGWLANEAFTSNPLAVKNYKLTGYKTLHKSVYKINLFHGEYTEAAITMCYKIQRIVSSEISEILGKKLWRSSNLSSEVEDFKLATS